MKALLIFVFIIIFSTFVSAEIERSWNYLPFGNGNGFGIYKTNGDTKVTNIYDHIYKEYRDGIVTDNYVKNGVIWGINDKWIGSLKVNDASYINGTGIVEVNKADENIEIKETYFMPFESDKTIIVAALSIKNNGEDRNFTPYLYIDAALSLGGSTNNETSKKDGNFFVEGSKKNGSKLFITYTDGFSGYTYNERKEFPENAKKNTFELNNVIKDTGNYLVGVVRFNEKKLKKGETTTVYALFGVAAQDKEDEYKTELKKRYSLGFEKILENEKDSWKKWHELEKLPKNLTEDERRLVLQSTAILKMGQSREADSSYGQILASLPPGEWNICWPRDAAYSIISLIKTGHLKEAKDALEFFLKAPNGKFNAPEYVGKEYKISVCRYYGNGDEWSDYNAQGPNIEFDDFGLFLWAFSEYIKESKDKEFLGKYYDTVKVYVADVILSLMESEGYLKEDSSIWERHWTKGDPDGKKHFAYSTINGYNGLKEFSEIANMDHKKIYQDASEKIKKGFVSNFLADGVIVQSLQDKTKGIAEFMDASGVEAINFNMVDDDTAKATLKAYEKYLKMKKSPGFKRNDDGTWYDDQEWIMIDMGISRAYNKYDKKRSYELINWVTENAKANYLMIPELLDEKYGKYTGAIPMCGFGAGCYIMALYDYYSGN